MKYLAKIKIMPLKALLDPQGKAVLNSSKKIGFNFIENVRIGKSIEIELEASSREDASQKIDSICQEILINPIIEYYEYNISEI
ncbi:MAG: phosphoribosylformylglycinamidine synthase subunit PurS [Anaerophaga sp.]|nr:phosphoribosylformylglycinamidine synthase subunit PurS [Anaerophaga sp.]